jgi:hypothetical protein
VGGCQGDGDVAGLAVLAALHGDDAGVEINVGIIELQGFVDAQACDSD